MLTLHFAARSTTDKKPYPLTINDDGTVPDQLGWPERPARLIGFTTDPNVFDIALEYPLKDELGGALIVGMCAVFEDFDGEWATWVNTITEARHHD